MKKKNKDKVSYRSTELRKERQRDWIKGMKLSAEAMRDEVKFLKEYIILSNKQIALYGNRIKHNEEQVKGGEKELRSIK